MDEEFVEQMVRFSLAAFVVVFLIALLIVGLTVLL